MSIPVWFDDLPVLGEMPPTQAATKLRELGEVETATTLENIQPDSVVVRGYASPKWRWPFQDKPWQHTAHAFGYLESTASSVDVLSIQHAGNISADLTLKNSRVKITFDRLYVAAYPGGGTHHILFDFYAQNQVPGKVEHLHFNATFRVNNGGYAAIIGYPLFVGLHVGTEGIVFKCFTVNVHNENDEAFLGFLDSDVFKAGLQLVETAQPAIAPLSEMAVGLTRAIARRYRNVPVQNFYMGLDFSYITTRARLAEGSYLAVQIPNTLQENWNWNEWVYNPANGQVVSRFNYNQSVPYNYLTFSVSRL